MTVQILVNGRTIPFRLDHKNKRWHALETPDEGSFPLITVVNDQRFELYSDGTFAEVEK
jgi:hypothetical protein